MARKKLGSEIKSVRDGVVKGIFIGVRQLLKDDGTPMLSKTYGSELHVLDLADLKTKETVTYWADGGLRGALKRAGVKDGMSIEIEYTGQTEFDGGRVNSYDIFEVTTE